MAEQLIVADCSCTMSCMQICIPPKTLITVESQGNAQKAYMQQPASMHACMAVALSVGRGLQYPAQSVW